VEYLAIRDILSANRATIAAYETQEAHFMGLIGDFGRLRHPDHQS